VAFLDGMQGTRDGSGEGSDLAVTGTAGEVGRGCWAIEPVLELRLERARARSGGQERERGRGRRGRANERHRSGPGRFRAPCPAHEGLRQARRVARIHRRHDLEEICTCQKSEASEVRSDPARPSQTRRERDSDAFVEAWSATGDEPERHRALVHAASQHTVRRSRASPRRRRRPLAARRAVRPLGARADRRLTSSSRKLGPVLLASGTHSYGTALKLVSSRKPLVRPSRYSPMEAVHGPPEKRFRPAASAPAFSANASLPSHGRRSGTSTDPPLF